MAVRRTGLAGDGLRLALVAVAYYVSARLGLELALVHGQVTPVWPPTGIALVAILVFGVRVWPAVAVAAFAVNLPIGPTAAECGHHALDDGRAAEGQEQLGPAHPGAQAGSGDHGRDHGAVATPAS